MNPHYDQHYTVAQIEAVLLTIKECIGAGRFQISMMPTAYTQSVYRGSLL